MKPEIDPLAEPVPAPLAGKAKRRRKRDIAALVAGVATTLIVVGLVLALAVGALFVSGFVPLTGLQRYVASDLQKRLGVGWTVTAGKAAIVRTNGHAALQIRNAEFQHASGLGLHAPDADIRYDPMSLLSGRLRISSIDIRGVSLRLQVDQNKALILDTGSSKVAFEKPTDSASPSVIEQVAASLAMVLDEDAILQGLDRVALTNARLTLVAPDGQERVGLDGVSIMLSRQTTGRELRLTASTMTGNKDVVIKSTRDDAGKQHLAIKINALRLDSLERLFVGPDAAMLTGFPVTGTVGFGVAPDGGNRVTGALTVGAGRASVPDSGDDSVSIDRIAVSVDADAALRRVNIPVIEVDSGATKLKLDGQFERNDGPRWSLSGTASGVIAGEGTDPPQIITRGTMLLEGSGIDEAVMKSMTVDGPQMSASGNGHAAQTPDGPEVYIRLKSSNSQVRSLLAAWPPMISPIIRKLLVERVETGLVQSLDLALDMTPAALRAARVGDPSPDESVNLKVAGSGVRFAVGDGIPKLHDLVVTATGTGRTLAVQATSARIDLAKGRQLALSEGTFGIADTWGKRPIGRVSFRAQGSVDALAELVASPALKDASPGQVDPDSVKGRIDLRSTATLPLIDNIKPSDVIVQSSGTITGLTSDALLGNEKLEAGNLAANFERGNLSLRGDARIGGVPAQIDLRQDGKGIGEAVVTMTVDQATRQRRGFNFAGAISGPVSLRVVKPLGRKPDASPRFEIDLARAAIDGLLPGWTKPVGRAGRLNFTLDEDDDKGPDLNDLVLESGPVLLRGKVAISNEGQLQRASFSQFRLSTGDDMRVEVRREGNVNKVTVRGQVADARPFLKPITSSGTSGKPPDAPEDIDVDLAIPILTGFNGEVIGNASLKFGVRGKALRQLELTGRIGRAPINVQHSREGASRRIRIKADDGGAFLRYLDFYRRAYGGELIVDARPSDNSVAGDITFSNFRVRGEPALKRVLGEQFAQAPTQGPDGVRASRPVGSGDDVPFIRLKGSFVRNASRFEIKDGVIWGNEIGVSAQGSIDYARDRADIAGTFVPGFALNNAFSQVPILGPLLGGGRYEGLFAVNFRIAGSATSPSLSVNPLSALAPGILRRFIDPLGGIPAGQLQAAPPAPER
ncbi:MAG: hypothetical protein ACRCUE_07790 [Bosea sp. (in: a-proteobacteria)]